MEAQLLEAKLKIGGEEINLPFSVGPATFGETPLYCYDAKVRWQTNHFANGFKQIEFSPKVKVWRTNPGLVDGHGNVIQEPYVEEEATFTLPVALNVNVQNVALVNATQICDAEVVCPVPGTPEYVLSAPNQAALGVADARAKLSGALYDVIANDQHYESAILEGSDPLLKKSTLFFTYTHGFVHPTDIIWDTWANAMTRDEIASVVAAKGDYPPFNMVFFYSCDTGNHGANWMSALGMSNRDNVAFFKFLVPVMAALKSENTEYSIDGSLMVDGLSEHSKVLLSQLIQGSNANVAREIANVEHRPRTKGSGSTYLSASMGMNGDQEATLNKVYKKSGEVWHITTDSYLAKQNIPAYTSP